METENILPDTQLQNQQNQEFLTNPACYICGKQEASGVEGICWNCKWVQDREKSRQEYRTKENTRRRNELIEAMGEGAAEKFTLENFKPYDDLTRKALAAATAFHPSTTNLYLCGTTGCGKTHLAVGVALKAFDADNQVHFFPSGPALARWFRGIEARDEEARIKALATCDLLVINELGIGRDTEFSIQMAVEVIDARIMRGKNGLIVTSNLHPAELAAKSGDSRLESRFTGLCKIIEVGKEDYRKKHRQA